MSLRNIIHLTFVEFYESNKKTPSGYEPEKWLFWLPQNPKTKEAIRLASNNASHDVAARGINIGDIISRLSFGVWANILSEQPDIKAPLHFWRFTSKKIFPNAPQRKQPKILHRLKEVKLIRNRLFHFEPIWDAKKCKVSRQIIEDVYKKYNIIMDTIHWITSDTSSLLVAMGYGKMMDEVFHKSINELERQKGG